jgi:DNA-binding NtrC family response regulator
LTFARTVALLSVQVAPTGTRADDIPILADRILVRLRSEIGRADVTLAPDAEEALRAHTWPGNIRELRNVLERAVLLCTSHRIGARDLRFDRREG